MPLSGQKTIPTSGAAEPLGSQPVNGPLAVRALDSNTNLVAIGNDGANDVTLANGYCLAPSEHIIFDFVGDLASLYLDAAVNGEGIAWLILNA